MKVLVTKEYFTPGWCLTELESLFIFGDNMVGTGHGGQAIIRGCPNAFGIPTKRLPSRYEEAYMSDQYQEGMAIATRLDLLERMEEEYDNFIFPADGLGTGLAKMPEKSPELFSMMMKYLNTNYGVYKEFL